MVFSRSRRFTIVFALGILTSLSPFAIDVYLAAFPQIASDLNTTSARVALSLSSYFVGLAIGKLIYGPLLDRFGRKRPLYAGLTLFIIACIGCVQAQSVEALIAWRFVQALGGCVSQVAAMTMVRDLFPPRDSARMLSMLMLVVGLSPLFAPTAGMLIATAWGWQFVFVGLVFMALLIGGLARTVLPVTREPDASVSLHPVAILKDFASILRVPQFHTYVIAGSLSFAGLFVYVAGSPLIFLDVFGVSVQDYGVIFAVLGVAFVLSGQINVVLSRWATPQRIFQTALAVQTTIALVFLIGTASGMFGLVATIVLIGGFVTCLGMTYPNAAAIALAPFVHKAGRAAALIGSIQIGTGALISSGVGLFDATSALPTAALMAGGNLMAMTVLVLGKKRVNV